MDVWTSLPNMARDGRLDEPCTSHALPALGLESATRGVCRMGSSNYSSENRKHVPTYSRITH